MITGHPTMTIRIPFRVFDNHLNAEHRARISVRTRANMYTIPHRKVVELARVRSTSFHGGSANTAFLRSLANIDYPEVL